MERIGIKNCAKDILSERRAQFALFLFFAGIIYFVINGALAMLPLVGIIISFIVGVIYKLMIQTYTINLCNSKNKVDCERLFPDFTPIWKYGVVSFLITIVMWVVLIIPIFFLVGYVSNILLSNSSIYISISFLVILVIGLAVSLIFTVPTIFLEYIILENQHYSIGEILATSFKLGFSNIRKIIVMQLTLIPWFLLVPLTLGIGSLYVVPYINTIYYVMYKDIRGEEIGFSNKIFC